MVASAAGGGHSNPKGRKAGTAINDVFSSAPKSIMPVAAAMA
jgi:hypothetical protein